MPVSSWSFKDDDEHARHIGPMAQDFHAAFSIGTDDRHIGLGDEAGVALAAIQGLNQKLEEESQAKDAEIGELKRRLDDLESLVKIEASEKVNGGCE